jgi:hypothetical protein
LTSFQIGAGFASNTPQIKEKRAANAAANTKVEPALKAVEQYAADLDADLAEIESSKEYTKRGGERYSKDYLEDRYRKYSAADYNITKAIKQHPMLSEKYGETQKNIRSELNKIRDTQEKRGYISQGRKKFKQTAD